jgi:hypothetical protein
VGDLSPTADDRRGTEQHTIGVNAPISDIDWKAAVRQRILSARRVLLRHPWASRVIESRTNPSPIVLGYMDSTVGMFRAGGFSVDLTHHVMHALGSRLFGFAQEVFHDSQTIDPETQAIVAREMSETYPHLAAIALAAYHEETSVVGQGCDDQFEFEFALDLLLDGFAKLLQPEQQSRQSTQPTTKRQSSGRGIRARSARSSSIVADGSKSGSGRESTPAV